MQHPRLTEGDAAASCSINCHTCFVWLREKKKRSAAGYISLPGRLLFALGGFYFFYFFYFIFFIYFFRRGWNFLPAARNNTSACLSAISQRLGTCLRAEFDSSSWGTAHRLTETEEHLREDRLLRRWCPGFCFYCCWWISEWRKVKLKTAFCDLWALL